MSLLGRFELRHGDRLVLDSSWKRRKGQTLLKLLALQTRRALHREQLLDVLWPDLEPAAAAGNLRQNLYYIRNTCNGDGASPLVAINGDMVTLSPAVWLDVDDYRARARAARTARTDTALYEHALLLCGGELLPEDIYEEWTRSLREEMEALCHQLLVEVSHLYELAGLADAAIERLEQVMRSDPLHEEACRRLMRLYDRDCRRQRALRRYQDLRRALDQQLGVQPSSETQAVYQQIADGRLNGAGARTPPAPPADNYW